MLQGIDFRMTLLGKRDLDMWTSYSCMIWKKKKKTTKQEIQLWSLWSNDKSL